MKDESVFADLISRWQREHERGRDVAPAELCRDRPELRPELERRLDALRRLDHLAGEPPSTVPRAADSRPREHDGEGHPPSVPGYEVLGELGRGGMGVVYKARQVRADRVVALKVIGGAAGRRDRDRFRTEAEAAARVRHPHVAQVYEVGEWAPPGGEPLPFFSMEFCGGGSLARKLDAAPLEPREAASVMEFVARAVRAAHEQRVLHRDLKPGNVLLLEDGTPKVADFGLAKKLDESGHTHTGEVLGTPSYMAPEQARGDAARVGPAADVYGLGAVLYECLTGRPPFRAANPLDTILQAVSDDPVPPSRLQPKTPRDLETICLKCLQKEPAKRYASALGLAEDLRRFSNGEPIVARPAGPAERAWRWFRRNPRVAGLAAALAVVVAASLAGLTALYLRADRLRELAETNEDRAKTNLELAQANLDKAGQAVNECFTTATEHPLLQGNGMQPVRQVFLRPALKYYQGFIEQRPDDPAFRAELARNYYRVGLITGEIASKAEALEAQHKARAIQEELTRASADDLGAHADLARTCGQVAVLEQAAGRADDARRSFLQAAALWEKVTAAGPRPDHLAERAKTYNLLGDFLRQQTDKEQALSYYQKAIDIQEQLLKADPGSAKYRRALAASYHSLGYHHHLVSGDARQSRENYQKALDIDEELVKAHPEVPLYKTALGITCNNIGILYFRVLNQPGEALRSYNRARELQEELVLTNPSVAKYREGLAMTYGNLGNLTKEKKPDEARKHYEKNLDLVRRLVKDNPGDTSYRFTAALSEGNLGHLETTARRFDEGITHYRASLALLDELVKAEPKNYYFRSALGQNQGYFGECLTAVGRPAEAVPVFRQAIKNQRVVFEELKTVAKYRKLLGDHHAGLATAQRQLGQLQDAVASLLEHRRLWPADPAQLYDCACGLAKCARAVGGGKSGLTAPEEAERRKYADLAMETLRDAVANGYKDADHMEKDPDLESLRSHSDFAKLLAEARKK